ncbi:MAG: TonB-dependent receptor [Sphingobacteriia bacterium]|nr:MAG: TonB-dependent receptor [Sphingobacteriia bacterium]TAG30362.1 MAG: TonB-dependent receptor [Sphingobacteriia bacterium]
MWYKYKITLLSLCIPILCIAQNETDSTTSLQEIIVTATRKNSTIFSTPYSINVIHRRVLNEYNFRTIPDALVGMAGVFIQKTNHGGGSPFVRGLTGNQTLLMIDGIRFNNSTFRFGPNQYLNTIDAYTVSKIEIARGTGSVQFGSDALGGVVHILTKEPIFKDRKTINAIITGKAASQNMEYTGRVEVLYQSKKIAFLVGHTNRYFGDLVGGDSTGIQTPSGYKEKAFDVKFKWKINTNATLTVAHQYLQQRDVPLYHRVKLENFNYYFFAPQQRTLSYVKLVVNTKYKFADKITFINSYQSTLERRSHQKNGSSNKFLEEDKVKTLGLTLDITSNILKNWTANTGIEFYHDKVNSIKQQIAISNNISINQRGLYPNNANTSNLSFYNLNHIQFNKITIEAGLRYNSISLAIPDTATNNFRLGNIIIKPSSLVANAALSFHIDNKQIIYSSFSTGYRTPNIDDMGTLGLVDFRYEIPAYNLVPEKTYNSEIGYRFNNKKLQTSVAVFYMYLANLITRVQIPDQQVAGYNMYTKVNSQTSFLYGVEANIDYMLSPLFSIKSAWSYAYGQNRSRNEPMRRIPPLNGSILLRYQKNKWQTSISYLLAGKQNRLAQGDKDDNRIPTGGTPGFSIINIYGGYVSKTYTIRLGIHNILNNDYRTHGSGINGVGRSATIGFDISL